MRVYGHEGNQSLPATVLTAVMANSSKMAGYRSQRIAWLIKMAPAYMSAWRRQTANSALPETSRQCHTCDCHTVKDITGV